MAGWYDITYINASSVFKTLNDQKSTFLPVVESYPKFSNRLLNFRFSSMPMFTLYTSLRGIDHSRFLYFKIRDFVKFLRSLHCWLGTNTKYIENKIRWGFCPLRCGPDLMISVDHEGKLFERINAFEAAGFDKRYRNNNYQASHCVSEFLPTPRKSSGQGVFRSARAGFFCYFSCPSRKVKMS